MKLDNLNIKLNNSNVLIYLMDFNAGSECTDQFLSFLNTDEKKKANKFHFEKDRIHYIIGRGALKLILSEIIMQPPESILFNYNEYGKPFLKSFPDVKFNISHSNSKLLIAISLRYNVGIDIEFIRDDFATENIARQFFSEFEIEQLSKLDKTGFTEGFFNCWTRKEAFIKCVGMGLSLPLNSFDVELAPDKKVKIIDVRIPELKYKKYLLKNLNLKENYKAALCVEAGEVNYKLIELKNYC